MGIACPLLLVLILPSCVCQFVVGVGDCCVGGCCLFAVAEFAGC